MCKSAPGQNGAGSPPVLLDFYLVNFALRNNYVYWAEFVDPFNTFTSGTIHTDQVDISDSCFSKIRGLLEK